MNCDQFFTLCTDRSLKKDRPLQSLHCMSSVPLFIMHQIFGMVYVVFTVVWTVQLKFSFTVFSFILFVQYSCAPTIGGAPRHAHVLHCRCHRLRSIFLEEFSLVSPSCQGSSRYSRSFAPGAQLHPIRSWNPLQ